MAPVVEYTLVGVQDSDEEEELAPTVGRGSPRPDYEGDYYFPKLGYRRSIDGLRAIAVTAVVIFHFELGLPGGYVGVDVFFTISGYLISCILLHEIERGEFSVIKFWNRRMHRLQPALLCMMWIANAAGWRMWTDRNMRTNSTEGAMALLSLANFQFYQQDNYFESPEKHMFLHCWSLAVEEQFYLLYPSVCLLVWKVAGRLAPDKHALTFFGAFFLLLGLGSFVKCVSVYESDFNYGFYMLPARGWELLSGAFVSYPTFDSLCRGLEHSPSIFEFWINVLHFFGLGMIVLAMATYTPETPFPSFYAMMPCLGTVCAIAADRFAGEEEQSLLLNRFLTSSPVVWVGKISYSLYLWHWPIFVTMEEVFRPEDRGKSELYKVCGVAVSFIFAATSFYLVEDVFRRRRDSEWKFWLGMLTCWGVLITLIYMHSSSATGLAAGGEASNRPCFVGIAEAPLPVDVAGRAARAVGVCKLQAPQYPNGTVPWQTFKCNAIAASACDDFSDALSAYRIRQRPDFRKPWIYNPQIEAEPKPSIVFIGSSHCLHHMALVSKMAVYHKRHVASLCITSSVISFHGFEKDADRKFDTQRLKFLAEWKPDLVVWSDWWRGYQNLHKHGAKWPDSQLPQMFDFTFNKLLQHATRVIVLGDNPTLAPLPSGKLLANVERLYGKKKDLSFLQDLFEMESHYIGRQTIQEIIKSTVRKINRQHKQNVSKMEFIPTEGFFYLDHKRRLKVVDDELSQLLFYDGAHLTELGSSQLIPLWENYIFNRRCSNHPEVVH